MRMVAAAIDRLAGWPEGTAVIQRRVVFLPRVPTDTFLQLLAHAADVVLDTFPVGGCTTSLQAFSVGRPVLSLPSSQLRGRFTLGMLRRMGLEEPLVVTSADEY